jgi:poly(A) polymerase
MTELDPDEQRRFAVEVVQRLREAGHTTYWAGGCVRDRLLGISPKDYDIATDARPEQIRELFGHRRTLAIGAAFGVITVLGRKPAGQIEVATFRRDMGYSDGRRPDAVAFSTQEEDARRRDFTINGLFFDPVEERVLDFVDGQADLGRKIIRAIGNPRERFDEDKLRLLRAVRFAARFDFHLDEAARETIVAMAPGINVVSPERIAAELRAMLTGPRPALALRLLDETGLLAAVAPELSGRLSSREGQRTSATIERLAGCGFSLALAALFAEFLSAETTRGICRRLKLSNRDTDRALWLVEHRRALADARRQPWPQLQRVLIHPGSAELVALGQAAETIEAEDLEFCQTILAQPQEIWNPPPLMTGDDLLQLAIPAGKHFQRLLEQVRDAQLDKRIHTRDEALALAARLWSEARPGQ